MVDFLKIVHVFLGLWNGILVSLHHLNVQSDVHPSSPFAVFVPPFDTEMSAVDPTVLHRNQGQKYIIERETIEALRHVVGWILGGQRTKSRWF